MRRTMLLLAWGAAVTLGCASNPPRSAAPQSPPASRSTGITRNLNAVTSLEDPGARGSIVETREAVGTARVPQDQRRVQQLRQDEVPHDPFPTRVEASVPNDAGRR